MTKGKFQMARLGDTFDYIIDSDGNRVEFDDPRVVFCITQVDDKFQNYFKAKIHENKGWKVRPAGAVDRTTLRYAKKILTGRECLKFQTVAGGIYYDIAEKKTDDEIVVYDFTKENRPCKCAAWELMLETLAKRLELRNVIFTADVSHDNNFLGQGSAFGTEFLLAAIVSSILEEAETALHCLAADKDHAIKAFEAATAELIERYAGKGGMALMKGLKTWAAQMKNIPLDVSVADAPKLFFITSGGTSSYVPLLEYFHGTGILPKFIESSRYVNYLISEQAIRFGSIQGLPPSEAFDIEKINGALETLTDETLQNMAENARRSVIAVQGSVWFEQKLRTIALDSGLIYDIPRAYDTLLAIGENHLPAATFHLATDTVGRLVQLVEDDIVDCIVQVSTFGCKASESLKSICDSLIKDTDIPYSALQLEGPWLSVNQKRILENCGIQASRRKEMKERIA